ncbi:orotidine-5'-phosphate decarboxylase, partial [Litorivivens sp.]
MEAARAALEPLGENAPLLTAVTVLTSMEQAELMQVGVSRALEEQVSELAVLAENCGMDGVVCSARETTMLRKVISADFCLVTPGIRPLDSEQGDQRRVATPSQAIDSGSDYLVIGRPITRAESPMNALKQIAAELGYR